MSTGSMTKPRRETLNLRIPASERNLIDRAALLDRAELVIGPQAYAEFLRRLDEPARANDRLRRTMRSRAPWELLES